MTAVLSARDIHKTFPDGTHAVDGVSLEVSAGQCLGIVGESGSGKSTLARCLLTLETPDSGSALLDGEELFSLRGARLKAARRRLQVVFQNPSASFNAKLSIQDSVLEPLRSHRTPPPAFIKGGSQAKVAAQLLGLVQLDKGYLARKPYELSGGELQRVAIARAISVAPRLIVFDEPTASLDVSIQAHVLNLLQDLKQELNLSALFISHDLAAVQFMSERSIVLKQGRIVDEFSREELIDEARAPYTKQLIALFDTN